MKPKLKRRLDSERAALEKIFRLLFKAEWRSLGRLSVVLQQNRNLAVTNRGAYVQCLASRFSSALHDEYSSDLNWMQSRLEARVILMIEMAIQRIGLARRYLIVGNTEGAIRNLSLMTQLITDSAAASGFILSVKLEELLNAGQDQLLSRLLSQAELKQFIAKGRISKKIVIVLGMHRSGTSALTGLMCHAGLTSPNDQMPLTDANPKGYWESVLLYSHNEDFLTSLGASWHSPELLPSGWEHLKEAQNWRSSLLEIVSSVYANKGIPIIKDPRFCVLISGLNVWLESPDIEVVFLLPVRHPHEVAKSLSLREGLSVQQGLHLWMIYTYAALRSARSHPHVIVPFDDLISSSRLVAKTCQDVIGASLSGSFDQDFIDSKHRHQVSTSIRDEFRKLTPKDKREEEYAIMLFNALVRSRRLDRATFKQVQIIFESWKRHTGNGVE